MTTLTYNDSIRQEDNPQITDNLIRKGWKVKEDPIVPEIPYFDANIEKIVYDDKTNTNSVISLTDKELAENAFMLRMTEYDKKIKNGFLVSPENFILAIEDDDRNLFAQMLLLVKEALDLGMIDNDAPQTILDKDGNSQTITTLRFRQIMVGYGMYYKSLWDQME